MQLGCGAKLQWKEDKFVHYEGFDFRMYREKKKEETKECMVCGEIPARPRPCCNCKEVVCAECIEKCKGKCLQCEEEDAFTKKTVKKVNGQDLETLFAKKDFEASWKEELEAETKKKNKTSDN